MGVTGNTTLPAYSEPQPVGPTPAIDWAEVRRVVEEAIPTILGSIVNQIPRIDDLRRMMTEVAQGNVQQIVNQVRDHFQAENRLMVQAEMERQAQMMPGGQGQRVPANPPGGQRPVPHY